MLYSAWLWMWWGPLCPGLTSTLLLITDLLGKSISTPYCTQLLLMKLPPQQCWANSHNPWVMARTSSSFIQCDCCFMYCFILLQPRAAFDLRGLQRDWVHHYGVVYLTVFMWSSLPCFSTFAILLSLYLVTFLPVGCTFYACPTGLMPFCICLCLVCASALIVTLSTLLPCEFSLIDLTAALQVGIVLVWLLWVV